MGARLARRTALGPIGMRLDEQPGDAHRDPCTRQHGDLCPAPVGAVFARARALQRMRDVERNLCIGLHRIDAEHADN